MSVSVAGACRGGTGLHGASSGVVVVRWAAAEMGKAVLGGDVAAVGMLLLLMLLKGQGVRVVLMPVLTLIALLAGGKLLE